MTHSHTTLAPTCLALTLRFATSSGRPCKDYSWMTHNHTTLACAQPWPAGSEVAASWQHLVQDDSSYGQFFEFPAISPERRGQPYRYAYAACATRPTNAANSLGKFDNEQHTCKVSSAAP